MYSSGVTSEQREMQRTVILVSLCSCLDFFTAGFLKIGQNLFVQTTEACMSSLLGDVVTSSQGGPQLEDSGPCHQAIIPLSGTHFCHLGKRRLGLDVLPSSGPL